MSYFIRNFYVSSLFLGEPIGDWSDPNVLLIFQKELKNNYLLFKGSCNVSVKMRNKNIPYKYVIYKGGSKAIEWERLPNRYYYNNGYVNRCLIIQTEKEQFTKYDDAITKHPIKDVEARKITFKALLNLRIDQLYEKNKIELFALSEETLKIRNSFSKDTQAQKLIDNDKKPFHRYVQNFP